MQSNRLVAISNIVIVKYLGAEVAQPGLNPTSCDAYQAQISFIHFAELRQTTKWQQEQRISIDTWIAIAI